jgi:predicted GH43/DUF377 family glycosyl hydrolase
MDSQQPVLRRNVNWIRDPRNPILPPGPAGSFDSIRTMNPWVIRRDNEYHLYYSGGDADGRQRICLATAPVSDLSHWHRQGTLFDNGPAGAFDHRWCVLPHVVQLAPDRWHLYYTGNSGEGSGLSAFPGLGVAISHDGKHWSKFHGNPILARTGREGDPDAQGIAGGSVVSVRLPEGHTEWRFYYTACPTLGNDVFLNQQKIICLATSADGLHWTKKGAVLWRDPERDYANVAVATPVVHQLPDGSFQMWFSQIGTRWGFYSIGYAESNDGLTWRRGNHYGDELQLGPGTGWDAQMVEYPSVVTENNRQRLFFCGNGYGGSGIGTALSTPLRATAAKGPCLVHLTSDWIDAQWILKIPEGLLCEEGIFKIHDHPVLDWHGPDANGMIWHEWEALEVDLEIMRKGHLTAREKVPFLSGIRYRVILKPDLNGLNLRLTLINQSANTFHNVTGFPCLSAQSESFHDPTLSRTWIQTAAGLTSLDQTGRGTIDSHRTHYLIEGATPINHYGEFFWGKPSSTLATRGVILRSSRDGRFTIGLGWDSVSEIFQNEDAHHCLHSLPAFGDLLPGQTQTVCGRIVLAEGGPEEALALLG